MTDWANRTKGENDRNAGVHDPEFVTGGIVIDNATYDDAHSRIYNVKGMSEVFVRVDNEGGTNDLDYRIDATEKEFDSVADLADADFTDELKVEATVQENTSDESTQDVSGPKITAVRIQFKETIGGSDTLVGGIVSAE